MPNKLLIKANFCDLRNVKEETLAAYDVIEVRANVVVLIEYGDYGAGTADIEGT